MEICQLKRRITRYRCDDTGLGFTIAYLTAFAVFLAGLLIWITTC